MLKIWPYLYICIISVSALAAVKPLEFDRGDKTVNKLAFESQWLRLLQYQDSWTRGVYSQADNPAFFLSERGHYDSKAELLATIEALQSDDIPEGRKVHPVCQYPARKKWLQKHFPERNLEFAEVDCPVYEQWKNQVDAEGASLIFSSYYLDAPASTFGHSLLRLHRRNRVTSAEKAELLDTGINFAATVPDMVDPVTYALFGLFGGWQGQFSSVPYFYKIREYNDFETRDIWSYELDFNQQEVDMLVDVLWELGHTHFDYFFFTENCSYHIFSALETAKPSINLKDKLPFYVIPSETLRIVAEEPGLVKEINFRPSVRRKFEARYSQLDPTETGIFLAAAEGEGLPDFSTKTNTESKRKVLDTMIDYFAFKYPKALIDKEPEKEKWKTQLLISRAKLGVVSPNLSVPIASSEMPHKAHPSGRLNLGGGTSIRNGGYAQFGFRFALHDLLDPIQGYPDNAEIQFWDSEFRQYQNGLLELSRFNLLRMSSMSESTAYATRKSFSVTAGLHRIYDGNCESCLAGRLIFGPGMTKSIYRRGISLVQLFGFAEFEALYSEGFSRKPLLPGAGGRIGARASFSDRYSALIEGSYRAFYQADDPELTFGAVRAHYHLQRSTLGLEWRAEEREASVSTFWGTYF